MNYKNTNDRYGLIAIALHWIVALGFLAAYVAVYYRHWFTEVNTPENWTALQLHLSFGLSVAVFVILRLIWKSMNKPPKDLPGTKFEHFAAHTMHYILYAIMIVMPLTGYFGTGVNTEFFLQFEIPKFADTAIYKTVVEDYLGSTWETFEPPMDWVHKRGGEYFVWVMILAHASAALYHHFIRKDDVLKRMLSTK